MATSTPDQPEDRTVPPTRIGGKRALKRVRGTVSEGVERGCTLLTSQGAVYLLILPRGTLVTAEEIEVEGTVQPDLRTTCQQGTPLVVERIISPSDPAR